MKSSIRAVLALVMVFTLVSVVALARGAPTSDNAFTTDAVSADAVTPNLALRNVPPMTTGFDVIQNITTAPHVANVTQYIADTSETLRLSSTVDWRTLTSSVAFEARSGPSPNLVMLA